MDIRHTSSIRGIDFGAVRSDRGDRADEAGRRPAPAGRHDGDVASISDAPGTVADLLRRLGEPSDDRADRVVSAGARLLSGALDGADVARDTARRLLDSGEF